MAGRALFASLAVLVFVFDRVTKVLVSTNVPLGTEHQVLPGVWITYTLNPGAAFGIAQSGTLILLLASIAVSAGLIYYVARNQVGPWTGALLGLILGGAVGNAYDRLVHGTVVDFVALHFWPVFNVADSAVSAGVALLLAGYVVRWRRLA
jgi:signal peptidase II